MFTFDVCDLARIYVCHACSYAFACTGFLLKCFSPCVYEVLPSHLCICAYVCVFVCVCPCVGAPV